MQIGFLFWLLMILAALAYVGAIFWPAIPVWGGTVLFFVLFALLGWKVFGPALHS